MSILDRLARPAQTSDVDGASAPLPGAARAAVVGVVTGLGSLAVPVVIALLAWVLDDRSSGPAMASVGSGAGLWLLAQGTILSTSTLAVSITPLLLTLAAILVAWFGLREALRGVAADGPLWLDCLRTPIASAVGTWWAGYAVVVLVAALLTSSGPFAVGWWSVLLPAIGVPLAALVPILARLARDEPYAVGPRLDLDWVPVVVRKAIGPALRTAGVCVLAGSAMALIAVVIGIGEVSRVHAALGAGTFGTIVVTALQLGAAPNLGLWALSFAAGPGFQVADGATTTWSGSRGALLPLLPVLGALPQPGSFPGYAVLTVLVPLALGAYAGRRAVAAVARLSSVRTKCETALVTAVMAAGAVALLDLLGGGALGRDRLAAMGAPAGWLFLALAAELAVGAVAVALLDAWRLRR